MTPGPPGGRTPASPIAACTALRRKQRPGAGHAWWAIAASTSTANQNEHAHPAAGIAVVARRARFGAAPMPRPTPRARHDAVGRVAPAAQDRLGVRRAGVMAGFVRADAHARRSCAREFGSTAEGTNQPGPCRIVQSKSVRRISGAPLAGSLVGDLVSPRRCVRPSARPQSDHGGKCAACHTMHFLRGQPQCGNDATSGHAAPGDTPRRNANVIGIGRAGSAALDHATQTHRHDAGKQTPTTDCDNPHAVALRVEESLAETPSPVAKGFSARRGNVDSSSVATTPPDDRSHAPPRRDRPAVPSAAGTA